MKKLTREEALRELDRLNAEADAWQARLDAMVAEAERIHGPDLLGYDTERDFMEVAREMAEDALSGRNREAVEAEIARFRSWRRKTDR